MTTTALLVLEFWLGKTKRVAANSSIELVINCVKAIIKREKIK